MGDGPGFDVALLKAKVSMALEAANWPPCQIEPGEPRFGTSC